MLVKQTDDPTGGSTDDISDSIREFMIAMLHAAPKGGLSLSAATVLSLLYEVGPQRITALATKNAVTQPATTALVQRLEATGLVIRVVDPLDSRARLVTITDQGIRVLLARRSRQNAAIAASIEELSESQVELLERLVPAFRQMSRQMKFRDPGLPRASSPITED